MERLNFYDSISEEKVNVFTARVLNMLTPQVKKCRLDMIRLISNNLLPPVNTWPSTYRILFFKTPLGHEDFAKLFWFLLGECTLFFTFFQKTISIHGWL